MDLGYTAAQPGRRRGWLFKPGEVQSGNWKKRWFVLEAGSLAYYEFDGVS